MIKINKKLIDKNYSIIKVHDDYIYFGNDEFTIKIINIKSGMVARVEASLKLL